MKPRLDNVLMERGLFETLEEARAAILAGTIWSGTVRLTKAGDKVASDIELEHKDPTPKFSSRAGGKLEFALEQWKIPVQNRVCLDIGASNGGFTDCLLKRGAKTVFSVDVGYGLLDAKLRSDSRVVVLERTNARNLTLDQLQGASQDATQINLVVVDVSFISLQEIIPAVREAVSGPCDFVFLFKPQFEVAREHVLKGGVARPSASIEAARDFALFCQSQKLDFKGKVNSPLPGKTSGNVEILFQYVATE